MVKIIGRRREFESSGFFSAGKLIYRWIDGKRKLVGYEGDPGLDSGVVTDERMPQWNVLRSVMQLAVDGKLESDE